VLKTIKIRKCLLLDNAIVMENLICCYYNRRYEVEEVRKKIALLVSHQDISMKRLRARPGGVSKS
jgi:hypothetical protein